MAFITTNVFMDILVATSLLLLVVVVVYKQQLNYWKRRGVYTFPATFPFGNAWDLVFQKKFLGLEIKHLYDELKRRGLRFGGYYFFSKPIFVPVDLDLVKYITTRDFSHFMDHGFYYNEELEPLTCHLFSLKGQKWKQLRSKLTPAFSSGKIKMVFDTITNCTKGLIEVVDETVGKGKVVDIKSIVTRFTTDVIGSCAFGLQCKGLEDPDSEFIVYSKKFFDTSLWDSVVRLIMMILPEVIGYAKIRTIRKELHDFFMNVVQQTVTYREENNIARKDFLHLLIQLKNNIDIKNNETEALKDTNDHKNKTLLTLNELAAQCFVFFIGGYETSSATISFLLYEIAQKQNVQDKLREEINNILIKYDGKITYEGILEMGYMNKCIYETLRKYPPIAAHMRQCTKEYTIPNSSVIIEKGSLVLIPTLGIQYDPDYYPNPQEFDPERFSDKNKMKHPSAWTPFGDGPRTCIGMKFAMAQMKVGLTALLSNYKFTLNRKTATPLVIDPRIPIIMSAKNGIWLNVERIVK